MIRTLKRNARPLLQGIAALWLLAASACGSGGNKAPDVSGIEINTSFRRLDQDLYRLDTNRLAEGLQQLIQKYPDFLPFYLDTLMTFEVGPDLSAGNPAIADGQLRYFLTQKDYRNLFDTVARHFPDTREQDEQLTKGFRYMKHYFPDFRVPKVVYLTTGLNSWSALTYEDVLGIGLDMFLGPGYPFYASVGIPEYVSRHLKPEAIPVAAFKTLYQQRYPFVPEGRTLLDMMLQRGREQYVLARVLPFTEAHTRFGFTEAQLQWCEEHEEMIYNFFIQGQLLYETNWGKILRYVNDAPTAAGMPAESPGNVGSWLGMRIVEAYMDRHPNTTLPQLAALDNAQQMLQQAQYKPAR